ncbi:hypothetical protein ACLQ3C_13775 [Gordonia sp. DT30]|uniref:hypothetical protein n=1 Tax=Gordonia sp. DT30 TaxID=3416546 RepID=UPI003CE814D3
MSLTTTPPTTAPATTPATVTVLLTDRATTSRGDTTYDVATFPTLLDAIRAREHRNPLHPTLLRIDVVNPNSPPPDSISVLAYPRSVASLITDIHLLDIADGVVLAYTHPTVVTDAYRAELSKLLDHKGFQANLHIQIGSGRK